MFSRLLYPLLWSLLALDLTHAACERAQELYQQALAPGVAPAEQVRLLHSSLQDCDSFAAAYALGRAYAAQDDVPQSLAALRQAVLLATTPADKAAAWYAMARLHLARNDPLEALLCYKAAWRLAQLPAVAGEMLALERRLAQEVIPAQQIVTLLRKGLASRSLGVVPASDVPFAFDSAALSPQGVRQAHEIGLALSDPEFQGQRFRLVGHTDSRGDDAYNDRLSRERALAVQHYVLTHFPLPPERVTIDERGKRELLYLDATEEAHARNRRVEVRIE